MDNAKSAAYLDPFQSIYEEYGALAFAKREDKTIEGEECIGLGVVETDLTFYISKRSKLAVGILIENAGPEVGTILVRMLDYSEHEGIMLPGRVIYDIQDGTITLEFVYDKTTFNAKLDESIFEKP